MPIPSTLREGGRSGYLPVTGISTGLAYSKGACRTAASCAANPVSDEAGGSAADNQAAKAPGMAESGLIGAGLAGAAPAVGAAAQWLGGEFGSLGKFVTDAFGKEAKQAAEDLRSGVSSETGKAMTAEEQKIAQAKVEEGAAKAKQAVADAELKHLDQQQERLRNRMQPWDARRPIDATLLVPWMP